MTRAWILGSLLLCAFSCEAPPLESRATENEKVTVEILFRQDGCTVYRFNDGDNGKHYFARCEGASAETIRIVPKHPDENIRTGTP